MANSKGNPRFIKPSELTFLKMLIRYVKGNELISIFHLITALVIGNILIWVSINYVESFHFLYKLQFTISLSIFSVLIAAFGLFAAITDLNFSKIIYEKNQLANFLFPFWLTSVIWTGCILISFVGQIFWFNGGIVTKKSIVILSISNYAIIINIGYTLALIGDIIRTTIMRIQMDYFNSDISQLNNDETERIDYIKPNNNIKFFKLYIWVSIITFLMIVITIFYQNVITSFITGCLCVILIFTFCKYYKKCKQNNDTHIALMVIRIFKLVIKLTIIVLNFYFMKEILWV